MGLLELVTTSRRARQVRKLAAVVADRSLPAVLERLAPHIHDMSSPEARGYIRARAAAVVHREASLVLSMEGRLPAWGHTEVIRQATSLVVQQLAADVRPVKAAPRRMAG